MKEDDDLPETNIILPRNYGIIIQSGTNRYFYDPARYVIGHAMISTQAELLKWLKKWQEFKRDEAEQKKNRTLQYDPKFPVDGIEDFLDCSVEEVESALIEGILKKEGSKNLWVVGGKEAVREARLYGNSLSGKIKSKSKGFNKVHINNPFVTREGTIQHTDIYSSDPAGDYESQKGSMARKGSMRVMGSHAAALDTANFMQLNEIRGFSIDYGKRNTKRLAPTLAFDFVSNKFLSNLEVDVLLARYVRGETFYEINRRLLGIPVHYSAALNRTAEVGKARFAVMRQKTEDEGRSRSYQINENRWVRKIREKIAELGFERMPYYTVVFKDSPFEIIAERYEKGDEALELACSFDNAPLVIKKNLHGDVNFHAKPVPYEENPFLNIKVKDGKIRNIGKAAHAVDDCTRRNCNQLVFLPSTLYIPKKIQSVYRRLAREAAKEEVDKRQLKLDFGITF